MAHGQIQQPSFYHGEKVLSSAAGAQHQNWEKAPIPSASPAATPPDDEPLKNTCTRRQQAIVMPTPSNQELPGFA